MWTPQTSFPERVYDLVDDFYIASAFFYFWLTRPHTHINGVSVRYNWETNTGGYFWAVSGLSIRAAVIFTDGKVQKCNGKWIMDRYVLGFDRTGHLHRLSVRRWGNVLTTVTLYCRLVLAKAESTSIAQFQQRQRLSFSLCVH